MPRTFVWHPGRGPKRVRTLPPAGDGMLRIKQVKSAIGHSWRMRQVLESLGLRHHQAVVIHKDSPALRGAIDKVRHLVEVTPAKE
ncbi:MAG: 50S ribosomal protein L30 [Gemmatimonadaceae bacterium]